MNITSVFVVADDDKGRSHPNISEWGACGQLAVGKITSKMAKYGLPGSQNRQLWYCTISISKQTAPDQARVRALAPCRVSFLAGQTLI